MNTSPMKDPSSSVSFIPSAFFEPSSFAQFASLVRAARAAGGTVKVDSLGRRASGRNSGLAAIGIERSLRAQWATPPTASLALGLAIIGHRIRAVERKSRVEVDEMCGPVLSR